MKKSKCNCKNFQRMVCDVCQGVIGKHIVDKPMKDHPIEECTLACFDMSEAIVVIPKKNCCNTKEEKEKEMKAIDKKYFSHRDMNKARKRGVISGLVWAIDLLYKEQKKAARKGLQTNALDIEAAIQEALNETRGPIKL